MTLERRAASSRRFLTSTLINNLRTKEVERLQERHERKSELLPYEAKKTRNAQKWNLRTQDDTQVTDVPKHIKPLLREMKSCGSLANAVRLFNKIKVEHKELHVSIFNTLMNYAARERNLMKIRELFEDVQVYKLEPDIISFSTALKAGIRTRNLDFAIEFWKRMIAAGVNPDVIAFSNIISACTSTTDNAAISAQRVQLAEGFFNEMKNREVAPNIIAYSALLNVYSKAGLWRKVITLHAEIKTNGLVTDEPYYNTIMDTFVRAGEFQRTVDVFAEARQERKSHHQPSYTTCMHAFCELGQHENVVSLWHEISHLFDPSIDSLQIYLKSLAKNRCIAEIDNTLSSFRGPLDLVTFNIVVHFLYSVGDVQNALIFFERAYIIGLLPIWRCVGTTLDLHNLPSGVALSAVRFVLADRKRCLNGLEIIVGRQQHSIGSEKSLGKSLRKLLVELGICFSEDPSGGSLTISKEELERVSTSNSI